MSKQINSAIPVPEDLKIEDWAEQRRIALEAWELGKKIMKPRSLHPAAKRNRP